MTSYGKKCKYDNDCYSKICEMTYNNKKPITRRCVVKNNIEVIDETEKKELKFGKECEQDSDCQSNICEIKYTKNKETGDIKKDSYCVIQKPKFGKECSYDSDCKSLRCKIIYDENNIPISRKCVIFDNEPELENSSRSFGDIETDYIPDYAKGTKWNQAKNEKIFLSNDVKKKKLDGRGIIADIIIILMEIIVVGIKNIFILLIMVWKLIFFVVSFIPSLILKIRFFSFSDKYRCKDSSRCDTKSCDPRKALTIKAVWIKKLMVILFPPYGLFLSKGISSIQQILIASVLTMMLYFPGLIYAFNIIDEDEKNK